jgi:hypothetical protein
MRSAVTPEWIETEARRLAPLLEGQYAAVVSGPDAVTAASLALAIARVHGATRRVAIADLVGDSPPLQAAIGARSDDDPHGISDSFLYGVSLNRIARPIDPAGNVFLMPSGTESVALEAVYRNDRWRRLAAGFQQVGALLLVVAVRDVPGFDALCQYVGALLPVGELSAPVIPEVRTLWLAPPPPPAETVRKVERAREVATVDRGERQSRVLALLAAASAVVLLGLAAWPQVQSRFFPGASGAAVAEGEQAVASGDEPSRGDSAAGTIAVDAPIGPPITAADNTVAAEETRPTVAPRTGPLTVANVADSSRAAAFAVYFVSANTVEEARPPEAVKALSAVAISLVPVGADRALWYRVTVGAGTDSLQAAALLTRLRVAGQVGATSGSTIRVPFAFRLEEGLAVESTSDAIERWARRGIRAYVLRQTSGDVTVYTGAFQTPSEAIPMADSLHAVGIPPTLVYRTGRTF